VRNGCDARGTLEAEIIELFRFVDSLPIDQGNDLRSRLAKLIEHVRELHDANDELLAMYEGDVEAQH
jgi:hypothetical protein